MDIYEILKVEATSQLTLADVDIMEDFLDKGRRAEVYLYYYLSSRL